MSTIPGTPQRPAFAVMPVVDYEPPVRNVGHCRPLSATAARRRTVHAPQHHPVRQPAAGAPPMSPPMRQATIFAEAALRRVLEVIDRRRPAAQLQGLLAAGLIDSVLAANRAAAAHDGAAVLRRVRLQAAGRNDPFAAAEAFGTYSRGRRVHAIACRLDQVAATRWQVVALHIG